MEYVETTGRTIEEAIEAALDQLGVAEDDAEITVVEEPRTGLFGRVRGEARVRVRIKPTSPRPKAERRRGGRDSRASGGRERSTGRAKTPRAGATDTDDEAVPATAAAAVTSTEAPSPAPAGGTESRQRDDAGSRPASTRQEHAPVDATVEDQARIMGEFIEGLLAAFEFEGTITEERVDEETIELHVNGDELGLLIGPKGQTLQAIQELSRTVVQRQASGTHHGRVRIDVAGYRQRRREALERFATSLAAEVIESGVAKALEPMHPADRKVIHDTVNGIDGVVTTSEGEEPRRRVVISPA